jgi:hypothetical protein
MNKQHHEELYNRVVAFVTDNEDLIERFKRTSSRIYNPKVYTDFIKTTMPSCLMDCDDALSIKVFNDSGTYVFEARLTDDDLLDAMMKWSTEVRPILKQRFPDDEVVVTASTTVVTIRFS